jgi:transposase
VAGVPFAQVNPRQARRLAEATGRLAKTDRLDAAMLARMGALLELKTRPPRSEALLKLKELYLAREALEKDRTAAKNRGKVLTEGRPAGTGQATRQRQPGLQDHGLQPG